MITAEYLSFMSVMEKFRPSFSKILKPADLLPISWASHSEQYFSFNNLISLTGLNVLIESVSIHNETISFFHAGLFRHFCQV